MSPASRFNSFLLTAIEEGNPPPNPIAAPPLPVAKPPRRRHPPPYRRHPPFVTAQQAVRPEMASNVKEDQKKKSQPQLLKLDKAFKLAEQWVNNMTKTSVNEKSTSVELEGRPLRLGIGATVPKESKFTHSNNPIERKLLAKLNNDKRKLTKNNEDLAPSAKNGNVDEDSEEDESESKTRAFSKKRPPSSISPRHMKKRRR